MRACFNIKRGCSIKYSLNEISPTRDRTLMTTVSKPSQKIGSDREFPVKTVLDHDETYMFYDDEK
jgi:hypothetical protein